MKIHVARIDNERVRISWGESLGIPWGEGALNGRVLPSSKYKGRKALTELVDSPDFENRAKMYYFLIECVGLPDNRSTLEKMDVYLKAGITIEDLLVVTKLSFPGSALEEAPMFYFLMRVLNLPKDMLTTKLVHKFTISNITPEMLINVDINELLSRFRGFGQKSITRLKKALTKY